MPNQKNRGVFGRSLRLIGMASRLAAKEVSEKLIKGSEYQARIDQAKIMTDALAELKGAAMKAGQLLSLEAGELLPKEATDILAKLQSDATPHDFSEIEQVLKKELGVKYSDIEALTEEPVASASIGQVHRARIRGEDVAIKVQYPGVRESIESDLKIIRRVGQSFVKASGKQVSLKELFKELQEVLEKETDYIHESENLVKYHSLLQGEKDYRVPIAHSEYCSPSVLVMSWEDGLPISQWIKETTDPSQRDRMAHLVLDLFCKEFSLWGFVQTDPNFANFRVNQKQQLVCLDFGATLEYDMDFRRGYAQVLENFRSGRTDEVFQAAVRFGLLDEREPREVQIAFKEMIQVALEPFDPHKQPFDFQNKDFEKRTKEVNLRFSRLLKYSAPPKKILFLHRKLGGIFNLVKRMGIKKDLMPYWNIMTQTISEPNE